jgi:tripartite-type tricarboxylate transporter receptor subunit TctC
MTPTQPISWQNRSVADCRAALEQLALTALAVLALIWSPGSIGQERWPVRPLQLIAPLSTGTTIDFVARLYAERLSATLGQSVVVQNRPGAGGTIAAQSVARAAPDGYTILIVNSQHSINPSLYPSLPYDTLLDFSPVAMIAEAPSVIAVHPSLGVKSIRELIDLARARPGAVNYGSAGVGTTTHLGGAAFAARAGIDLVHVPYKGPELLTDLLAGRVSVIFVPIPFVLQQIRDGKLIALAVTSREGMKAPLETGSVADSGLPGFEYATYYGFVAPAKVPASVMSTLVRAINQATADREVRARLEAQAMFPRELGPAAFDAWIRADMDRIAPVVRASGARAN